MFIDTCLYIHVYTYMFIHTCLYKISRPSEKISNPPKKSQPLPKNFLNL